MTSTPATPLPRGCARRYRCDRLLASGGHGQVWVAVQVDLERPVAIKLLGGDGLRDPVLLERFRQEAHLTARLVHPQIVRLLDHDVEDGVPWIAYELLSGPTLRDRLRDGPLPVLEALDVAAQIASGIHAAHAAGVLHRDLKPENVISDSAGLWKVADFGIAKWRSGGEIQTAHGMVVGTPGYLAPEQIQGLPATERSDLYSLGVLLHELLTGTTPFADPADPDVMKVMRRQIKDEAPRARTLRPDIPAAVEALVTRLIARDPEERPASADELERTLRALGDVVSGAPAPPARSRGGSVSPRLATTAAVGVPMPSARRASWVLALALGIAGSVAAWSHRDARRRELRLTELSALAVARMQKGEPAAAVDLIREAIQIDPDRASLWCDMARAHEQAGNDAETDRCLRKALALAPRDPHIMTLLGTYLERMGQRPAALGLLRQAVDLDPRHDGAALHLAFLLTRQGDHAEASRLLEEIEARGASTPLSHLLLAAIREAAGDDAGAALHYRKSLEMVTQSPAAATWTGSHLRQMGKTAEAAKHFALAEIAEILDSRMALEHALWNEQRGELARARDWYRRALDIAPRLRHAVFAYNELLRRQGDLGSSLALLDEQLALNPGDTDLMFARAFSLELADRLPEALRMHDELLERQPGNHPMLCRRGQVLAKLGRREEALAAARAARALPPDPTRGVSPYIELAQLLEALEETDDLEKVVTEGLAAFPEDPVLIHYSADILHFQRQDYARSVPLFQKALARKPDWIGPRIALADGLRELGRVDEAEQEYLTAVEHAPDSVHTVKALAHFYKIRKKGAEAARWWRRAHELDPRDQEIQREAALGAILEHR